MAAINPISCTTNIAFIAGACYSSSTTAPSISSSTTTFSISTTILCSAYSTADLHPTNLLAEGFVRYLPQRRPWFPLKGLIIVLLHNVTLCRLSAE
jgi:hypothetical protein